jgi:hypothetical protein
MTNRNEAFGRLLKAGIASIVNCEGKKAAIVEDELGQLIGISGDSIQRYKSGHLPPEDRTVEILAEASVQRGYLGREWLQRFLHAARYPFADTLLDWLCPVGPARPRPPRVYHNLPAPTYSQFVMREQAFAEVIDGLQQRSAAVLIVGLGGNGKTSLAREVAARCLQPESDAPLFDAVVWVSDKDRPGTTNLSIVLDEVARTLDYPGFTQFAHDEKLYEVGQLLKRQKVLLVIDNFETITDGALLGWLLRLPEPSKAILTSREKQRGLWSSWLAELRGMSEREAQLLINQRLRLLQLDKLGKNAVEFEPLVVVTGGNPKAIEMALGLVKHERRPLQHVVDDLHAARGELFDDLFTHAWALLDEAVRRVLLSMTFFPTSASGDALAATADVRGFAFDRAVERLTDLALLDVQQEDLNSAPRYALHPLVRVFAESQRVIMDGFTEGAQSRWCQYFHDLGIKQDEEHLETASDIARFAQEIGNYHAVLHYCYAKQHWSYLINLIYIINQFWSIRGYYQTRKVFVEQAFDAATRSSDIAAQIYLLSVLVRASCYEDDLRTALHYYAQARVLLDSINHPAESLVTGLNYAEIRICLLRNDLDRMRVLVEQNLAITTSERGRMLYSFDMAYYLYLAGRYDEAEVLLQSLIPQSFKLGLRRGPIRGWLMLGKIMVAKHQLDKAAEYLETAQIQAQQLQHQRHVAEIQQLWGQILVLRNDLPAARVALAEAINLFERLGMRRELTEARAELARLDE